MGAVRHRLTILAVPDLGAAVRFYQAAFGWPVAVDTPVYVEFALPEGTGLGLYDRRHFPANTGLPVAPPPLDGTSATELYFHVDDLDEALTRMERAGARLLSPPARRAWGDEAAYFADPAGNVLVLARPGIRRED